MFYFILQVFRSFFEFAAGGLGFELCMLVPIARSEWPINLFFIRTGIVFTVSTTRGGT